MTAAGGVFLRPEGSKLFRQGRLDVLDLSGRDVAFYHREDRTDDFLGVDVRVVYEVVGNGREKASLVRLWGTLLGLQPS